MPIEILLSADDMPVRHQELHEDEAVFWIGFLALIYRSTSGREYVNTKLDISRLTLEQLAECTVSMLLPLSRKKFWPSWFRIESLSSRPAATQSSDILRGLCFRIAQIQFMNGSREMDMGYSDVDELDEQSGRRMHALRHERVSKEVVEELGKTINTLKFLRREDGE
jgi:hypothetical protein